MVALTGCRSRNASSALYRGLALHPDDEHDPYLFRLDLSKLGMSTVRVAFAREPGVGTTALHADLQLQSLYKQPPRGDRRT